MAWGNPYGTPGTFVSGGSMPNANVMAPLTLPKVIRRVGEQAFWSTQRYAYNATLANTSDRVFAAPRGATGQGFTASGGLSIAETNFKEGGRVPGGQAFDVWGVACQSYYTNQAPINADDLRNLTNNCVLAWDFLQTQIEIAPTSLIGGGGGIFGSTADTGAADGTYGSRTVLNNGNGQVWLYREIPMVLAADTTFAILLLWGSLASAVEGGGASIQAAQAVRVLLLGRYQTALVIG